MGVHGPDRRCPCPRCYACDGGGCGKCSDGVRCSKRRAIPRPFAEPPEVWTPGLMMTRRGPRTVTCKLDMKPAGLTGEACHG
jgi:hypothetical protein